jgi:hypothetical protein
MHLALLQFSWPWGTIRAVQVQSWSQNALAGKNLFVQSFGFRRPGLLHLGINLLPNFRLHRSQLGEVDKRAGFH